MYHSRYFRPMNHVASLETDTRVRVPAGRIIKVTFFDLTLNPSPNTDCIGKSSVFITNIASKAAGQELKNCDQTFRILRAPLYSVGNSVQVRLSVAKGYPRFNASYEAID